MAFNDAFRGRRVLVTGHTGFKGAWLTEWLLALGAKVVGLALPPQHPSALFDQLGLGSRMDHRLGDICNLGVVREVVEESSPEFVFHLAAQPLVRLSYAQPVETYATNVLGTVHVLEAVRLAKKPCAVVCISTDKCYENREWVHGYREEDAMGGYDPYSSSKGAAELIIASYRRSFFSKPDSQVQLASARAGNVIGGGDWALDRIVPDCIRSLQNGQAISVRNKASVRPWQHVLEPLSGYLELGAAMHRAGAGADGQRLSAICGGFNFGPSLSSNRTVADLVQEILLHWPGQWEDLSDPKALHEAQLLNLSTDKAFHHLNWRAVWPFGKAVEQTVSWYRRTGEDPASVGQVTREHIDAYMDSAACLGLPWALK